MEISQLENGNLKIIETKEYEMTKNAAARKVVALNNRVLELKEEIRNIETQLEILLINVPVETIERFTSDKCAKRAGVASA